MTAASNVSLRGTAAPRRAPVRLRDESVLLTGGELFLCVCRQVKIRKMQLTYDPEKNKVVTTMDRMPRAYRAMADRNAKVYIHTIYVHVDVYVY